MPRWDHGRKMTSVVDAPLNPNKQTNKHVGTDRKLAGHLRITATEEHKDSLACGAQNVGLNSRNKSLLATVIEGMAKLMLAQSVH